MTFFEIPVLLLASALPFRGLCIFKDGNFFSSESRCALDFDCTCSSQSAGKTVGLVHMIRHAPAPSLSQSHCGLGRCFHFVYESLQMPQNSRLTASPATWTKHENKRRAPAMCSCWLKSNFQFLTAYIELKTE